MATPTRDQFVRQLIEMIHARFPLVKVSRAEQAFSLRLNGNVASLENLYRIHNLHPKEFKHHAERWVVEMLRVGEGMPDDPTDFESTKDRIFPAILPDAFIATLGTSIVSQPLMNGVHIAYALDHDRTISYLPQSVFEDWGMELDAVHETALENLVKKSHQINAHAAKDSEDRVSLILFQTMDGYDAARILLPTLHERLKGMLGSPFCAGIPNRDILLCFRSDDETVERLKKQIGRDFRQQPHQITSDLFLITPDGIAPHN